MESFDLANFSHQPNSVFLCQRCFAILREAPSKIDSHIHRCPVCEVDYDPNSRYGDNIALYLTHQNLRIRYSDEISYYSKLADIAKNGNEHIQHPNSFDYPPLRALYDAIASAKHFVHFSTYGINQAILGALEFASHNNIKVRGVATIPSYVGDKKGYNYYICEQINNMRHLHPNLEIRYENDNFVHSKFFVIDGLVMFSGSANATFNAYINIEKYFEDMEIITDFNIIREKHNRLFSNPWTLKDKVNSIDMDTGTMYWYEAGGYQNTGTENITYSDLDDIPF